MKHKKLIAIITLLSFAITLVPSAAFAATPGTKVTATIPTFKVTMNGQVVDNTYRQYPFLVYNDITYFPMTYWDMRFLGVSNTWSAETGSVIVADGSSSEYKPTLTDVKNKAKNTAVVNTGAFKVNGKVIDNAKEEYPILSFRDVPYFPLTWNWCQEFGWNINFDATNGLKVTTSAKKESSTSEPIGYKFPEKEYLLVVGKPIDLKVIYEREGNVYKETYMAALDEIANAYGLKVTWDANDCATVDVSSMLEHSDGTDTIMFDCKNNLYKATINARNKDSRYSLNITEEYKMIVEPVKVNGKYYISAEVFCSSLGAWIDRSTETEVSASKLFVTSNTTSFESSTKAVMKHLYRNGQEPPSQELSSSKISSKDYAHLAGTDFRNIKNDYRIAVAQCAYVYAYKNKDNDICVLIDLRYKIQKNWNEVILHNITTGDVISNPSEYYENLANRSAGNTKLHYMDLQSEVDGNHIKMMQAMSNVLKTGNNSFDGVFIDADTLNK